MTLLNNLANRENTLILKSATIELQHCMPSFIVGESNNSCQSYIKVKIVYFTFMIKVNLTLLKM